VITMSIVMDAKNADAFLIQLSGEIRRPKAFNDALGRRLARELQGHFRTRNKEPNKLNAPKTNFWKQVADATVMTSATDQGAVVSIAEQRFRIHLFGGKILPTGGRKFLTIPLIKEAHGVRAREYEKKTGHKLFRLPGSRVLVERDGAGDRSLMSGSTGTIRGKDGYRKINIGGQTRLRGVFALKESVTIKPDRRALPPTATLIAALMETGNAWLARNVNKESRS
jgi:phage antirepressor YoqD-like protein